MCEDRNYDYHKREVIIATMGITNIIATEHIPQLPKGLKKLLTSLKYYLKLQI